MQTSCPLKSEAFQRGGEASPRKSVLKTLKTRYVKPSNTFDDRNLQRKRVFDIYIDTEGLSKTLFYIHSWVEL